MSKLEPQSLVGTWRRFGSVGPSYQIIAIGEPTSDGADRIIKIRLAETGEETEYTLNHAVDDDVLKGVSG